MVRVEVSPGELLDRITILEIKAERFRDPAARARAAADRDRLLAAWREAGLPDLPQRTALKEVNEALWEVEDALREAEARHDFGPAFVARARAVYRLNDRRAALKRAVDGALDSPIREDKEYASYR